MIKITTNQPGRTAIPTTAAATVACTAPCECLSVSDAQAKWGAGGYTQCSQTPCYQYSSELGSISYYCFQKKAVTNAVIGNIPPVTTTLVPIKQYPPQSTMTTITRLVTPDPCVVRGKVTCGGTCVDIRNDPNNCGQCGGKCPGKTDTCSAGFCQAGCPADLTECNYGYCVDTEIDSHNCGSCGTVCMLNSSCIDGICVCNDGFEKCDGGKTCADVQNDPGNCGECGHSCSTVVGSTCCGGFCVNLQTNPYNCGSCHMACPAGQECLGGVCYDFEKDNEAIEEKKETLLGLLEKMSDLQQRIVECLTGECFR